METKEVKIKLVNFFDRHWYKLEFENKEVRYLPSVTTKLGVIDKPFLARWRGDLGNRECDMRLFEAQERGSRIHYAFDIFCRGGLVIYNPWQLPNYTPEDIAELALSNPLHYVCQYQDEFIDLLKLSKFIEIVKPKILMNESTVYSLKNNDAGTLDVLFHIKKGSYPVNGKTPLVLQEGVYVADLKTGSMVDKNAYRQTAAYVNCIKEMRAEGWLPNVPSDPIGTLILHTQGKNKNGIEGFSVHARTGEDLKNDYKSYRLAAALWEEDHRDDAPKTFEFPSMIQLKGVSSETTQNAKN